MTQRRRAALLGGLALVLGALAASDVAGREAALRRQVGEPVPVVVARRDLPAGRALRAADLAVRRVPARYAPRGAFDDPRAVLGLRLGAPVAAGADLDPARLSAPEEAAGPPGTRVRRGQRVAEVLASGGADAVGPGTRVDVLVTRAGAGGRDGTTTLALEDVEVLAAAPAGTGDGPADGPPKTALSLRVTLRQAVYLAAAQSFAREVRVLPRAAGDDRRGAAGLSVGEGL
jgi:pilus assembly protein CpaB